MAISRHDFGRRSHRRALIGFQNGFVSVAVTQYIAPAIVGIDGGHTSFGLRAQKQAR
jgi:hypothetical protein